MQYDINSISIFRGVILHCDRLRNKWPILQIYPEAWFVKDVKFFELNFLTIDVIGSSYSFLSFKSTNFVLGFEKLKKKTDENLLHLFTIQQCEVSYNKILLAPETISTKDFALNWRQLTRRHDKMENHGLMRLHC